MYNVDEIDTWIEWRLMQNQIKVTWIKQLCKIKKSVDILKDFTVLGIKT